ncbi:hypothetical protein BGZ65_008103 [Modicella reniformis]|uniref:Crinkler effector protein N-terminal domain-containing protein n=1 Tax=Modicella reniformis TaxID=1440133 RepID=A0A9P6J4R9_9FUNG|nr:hypothetical protein BGZ65_008103 [Modicella reniformis]
MADLTLYCLVDGEPTSRAFPVKIAAAKTVGQLKEAIRAEKSPEFDDIAADRLTLWKVSIPSTPVRQITLSGLNETDVKMELTPTDELSEHIKKKSLPKKAVHIIVQRPPQDQLTKSTSVSLGIIEKRGGEKICRYMADTETATLEGLQELLRQHFEQFQSDEDLQIFVYMPGNSLPAKLTTDNQLQSMLEIAMKEGWKTLAISLDSPAKSFSKYTWNEVVSQYGIRESPGLIPSFDIQPRSLAGDEREVLEHIVKDCTHKKNAYVFDRYASELTRSSIVDTFMVGAMHFHKSDMFLTQQQQMSGMRGHGPVDFAVVDRVYQNHVLGVTVVKTDQEFVQGLAQNIVQLDVAVQQKKRKWTEDDDDTGERQPVRFKSHGIVTDSYNWTLLECTLDEEDTVTYRAKDIPVSFDENLRGRKDLRDGCKEIYSYVLSLFDLMKNEIVNRSSYNSPVVSRSSSAASKRRATRTARA